MTRDLPTWLRDKLANPPQAGAGVHKWVYDTARQLHAHFPAGEIVRMLREALRNCGRYVPDSEIISAVQNSLATAWTPQQAGTKVEPVKRWPDVDDVLRKRIIEENGNGLADIWEASRVRLEDNEPHTEEIIDRLFPDNPLLCCGKSNSQFETKLREDWRGQLQDLALIVPSPMSAPTGLTKEGKESAHTLSNTGSRRFLVCEFDRGTEDAQAALLLHLAQYAPLVCAVHSGGKSLHGWFYCGGESNDEKILKFFRYACSLGADPATWTRSQFVRMPDGTRDNRNRQTVFFLNYRPLEARNA